MPGFPAIEVTNALLQALVTAFLAVLFLQSGVDKVKDRKGNLEYLSGHFAKSSLARQVPILLVLITGLELAAGVLSAIGSAVVILTQDPTIAFYGSAISAVTLLALFFGQRMAKDYPGAAALVPYFLLSLAAIYICAEL